MEKKTKRRKSPNVFFEKLLDQVNFIHFFSASSQQKYEETQNSSMGNQQEQTPRRLQQEKTPVLFEVSSH